MSVPSRVAAALARVQAEARPRVASVPTRPAIDPTLIVNAAARVLQQRRLRWSMRDEELTLEVAAALLLTFDVEPVRPPAGYQAIERPDAIDNDAIKRSLRSIETPGGDGKRRPKMIRGESL